MTLAVGTRLGPYEVLAALGAGGMGEVYRARDTKLNRDVALKTVLPSLMSDSDRVARFQREAQVLAALNHPNIAQIYGFEEGAPSCLVMELVPGETLADRIARGPVPWAEAVPIARQIAEALEAAHEQGIVHRDLKPANIKLRDDGAAKVLDFGLAKALEGDGLRGAGQEASPGIATMTTPAMTAMGMILGTAAYMAPEQTRGRPVDRRSDIWAFGCVLYEMLSGVRPFAGDDVAETLAAVLRADINWSALPTSVPRRLRDLLDRCLQRDPRQRLQAIGEARIALDRLTTEPLVEPQPAVGRTTLMGALRRSAPFIAAGIVLTAVATWLLGERLRVRPSAVPARRFVLRESVDAFGSGAARPFTISPDGRRIAFVSDKALKVWELDELQPRVLTGAARAGGGTGLGSPVWSPDGQSIAFTGAGKIWRIPANDGTPVLIAATAVSETGLAWLADGRILFTPVRAPMYEVSDRGGEPKVAIPLVQGQDVDFHQPTPLPEGRGFVYAVHRPDGVDTIEVFSGGARKVVMRIEGRAMRSPQVLNLAQYAPTGHLLYRLDQGNGGVWAVPFSLTTLSTTGEPFVVAASAGSFSVGADGTLVHLRARDAIPLQLTWFRPDGTIESRVGEAKRDLRFPALSPDGRRIAFASDDGNSEIWVADSVTGAMTRVTSTPGDEDDPVWVPGQNTLAFSCAGAKSSGVCLKAADGSGDTRTLVDHARHPTFSPDGGQLVYHTSGEARRGLMRLDFRQPDAMPVEFAIAASFERQPAGFTGDGRYFAYWALDGGVTRSYLKPFPGGNGQQEVPALTNPGTQMSQRGSILTAVNSRGDRFAVVGVPIQTSPSVVFGAPRDLFVGLPSTLVPQAGHAISADGQHLLAVVRQASADTPTGMIVVENWFEEFRRK